ncbi:Rrf2 family protein [Rhizobium sp. SG_E_25_P2]|uniref:RrF2 family transcriptional regulator n=1 Tax=Rhizobium sp. SG_E_25_P2 TaxID=2879942 RepID=UPI00247540E5|nr:Rrf2 family transcriptional regulator [Rhizobium sp. SG_E_25_P2]MDH6269603.1 Rrf2 family protein [Rhizobium sp. SG_E_25_P2]
MRLTRHSEIAIAILTACAGAPGKTIRTTKAAGAAKTTKDYAAHVVNDLVHKGFLKTTRGCQGGIKLAVPPLDILLGDVLRRMQPDLARNANVGVSVEPSTANAAFAAIVGAAEATFLTFMDRFSIADLVSEIAGKRVDCLDCELLNPARRKRDRAAAFTSILYRQEQSASRLQDEADIGLIVAECARRERNHHHANASR